MRWMSVAWAGCLLPVLAGCGSTSRVVHGASDGGTTDSGFLHARRAADDDLRRGARAAWEAHRAKHPRNAFSDEFRDGFTDGYADFLDRGEGSQPPAVPPVSYARYQKYFGPEGHGLVRDYYTGFNYGVEVASGTRRAGMAVPAVSDANPVEPTLRPSAPPTPPKPTETSPARPAPEAGQFGEPKKKPAPPILLPPPPVTEERKERTSIPPLPKPEVPVIKPFNPDLSGGGKFRPIPVPSEPERLPVPTTPFPVSEARPTPIPVPSEAPTSMIPPPMVVPVATIPPPMK